VICLNGPRSRARAHSAPPSFASVVRQAVVTEEQLSALSRQVTCGRLPEALAPYPAERLRAILDQRPARTFAAWAEAYRSSRVDYATETTKNMNSHIKAMAVFDDRDPAKISFSDVQEWIAGLALKPASVRRYLATLRAILDFAGVDPNPARDTRVKLPREEHVPVDPPSACDVEAIIAHSPPRWRLGLRTLAVTGMRVGEAPARMAGRRCRRLEDPHPPGQDGLSQTVGRGE
jgi:hypothetical protein